MDKEQIKSKIDFKMIEERTFTDVLGEKKEDYLIDDKGNAIIPIDPLNFKIIEMLLDLETRIKKLEDAKKEV